MILVAEQVSVTKRNKKIVRQVDLGVAAGEVLGLLGPNGAGKTTLLKAMGGLESISSGRVTLTGKSLADYDREERARRLAYLGQSEASHWDMEVEAVVRLGRLPHRRKAPATNEDAVARAMAATAVASLARRRIGTLSGGERARVMLARALAVEADVLLADEPIAGLDPGHQIDALRILRASATAGRAVVVVLHDLGLATRWCDRIALLHDGSLASLGAPDVILTDEAIRAAYGVDVVRGRLEDVPVLMPWRRSGHNS